MRRSIVLVSGQGMQSIRVPQKQIIVDLRMPRLFRNDLAVLTCGSSFREVIVLIGEINLML